MTILHLSNGIVILDHLVVVTKGINLRAPKGPYLKLGMADGVSNPVIREPYVDKFWTMFKDSGNFVAVGDDLLIHLGGLSQVTYGRERGIPTLRLINVGSEKHMYAYTDDQAEEIWKVLYALPGLRLEED